MKKADRCMDIYETFDYLVEKLLLTPSELEDRLEGFDPFVELCGELPDDEDLRVGYLAKYEDYLTTQLVLYQDLFSSIVLDSLKFWPEPAPKERFDVLSNEQLFFLGQHIRLARVKLKDYPQKPIPELYDREKDTFYPLAFLKALLF